MKAMLRPLTAEFIGTFGLVFVGAGAIVTDQAKGNVGLLGIAFAHGMVFAIMVTATMRSPSGCGWQTRSTSEPPVST
jgi:glycerol uptake facilitator-like aquaporin